MSFKVMSYNCPHRQPLAMRRDHSDYLCNMTKVTAKNYEHYFRVLMVRSKGNKKKMEQNLYLHTEM